MFFIDKEKKIDKIVIYKDNYPQILKKQKEDEKEKGNEKQKTKKLLVQKIDRNEENDEKHDKFSDDVIKM